MKDVIRNVHRTFIAAITLLIVGVIALNWASLEFYNSRQIAAPADISEVQHSAQTNAAFAEYLTQQKEYEAHFLTLASDIKQQESEKITRILTITSIVVLSSGLVGATLITRRLMKPVVEAYCSQERFIQDAAHELRNPLAAMTVTLQQAEKNGAKDPVLTTFKRQTKRLVNITEDLLFLERQTQETAHTINISELLADVIEEIQPIAAKRNIRFDIEIEPNITKLMTSSNYIRIAKNIVDNAVKYSHDSSKVTISQKKIKNTIVLTVVDHGIGIPKRDLANVGERFFRAHNTGTVDGTGLGLAIIHKILRLHGGNISLHSRLNHGTTATITLPA